MLKSLQSSPRILSLILLAGCVPGAAIDAYADDSPPPTNWRVIATSADRERLRGWRTAWIKALDQVAAAGQSQQIAPLGALMQPDAAQPGATPPAGDYACRVFKLGSRRPAGPVVTTLPPFTCRVAQEGGILSLTKLEGGQKPVGLLFPQDGSRMIFLGTMMLGDERRALEYGRDPERDMIGAFERIGDQRWRLVLPYPRWESLLDVVELVPKARG